MPKLAERATALRDAGISPCLASFRVGDREDDVAYERAIARAAEGIGVETRRIIVPAHTGQTEALAEITRLNEDASVHGVVIFRPLPLSMNEAEICANLVAEKDADGVTPKSMAGLYAGTLEGSRGNRQDGVFAPCTAEAIVAILDHFGIEIEGKRVAVIGRSAVIGKPVSLLLLARNATVTICHRKTESLARVASESEILVAAAGLKDDPGFGRDFFSAGQTVIDAGIRIAGDGRVCGDVNADEAVGTVAALTPVPGGVGSVTVLKLLEHVLIAAERRRCEFASQTSLGAESNGANICTRAEDSRR
jgi:methylenetetrahydrofolate dehydrogenase (NADP+)/methenyltetrahydrofolate cyclohydrolase